jgi:hypothetical protein
VSVLTHDFAVGVAAGKSYQGLILRLILIAATFASFINFSAVFCGR